MRRGLLIAAALFIGIAGASGQTLVDLRSQTRNVDFSNALSTKPFRVGLSVPSSCSAGEALLYLGAPAGQNLYICTATNTWVLQTPGPLWSLTGNTGKVLSTDGAALQWRGLGGDLSGSPDGAAVVRLQGHPVNAVLPLQGQLLRWDGANNQWSPSTDAVGSIFGRTGAVAALNGDYSFAQIAGTAGISQGGTGSTSAAGALTSLGAAAVVHTHVLTDIVGITGKQGTAPVFQMFGGGAFKTNDCARFDANGNLVSAGIACGGQPNYGQSFTSAATVTLTHNLSSTDLLAQCYDAAGTAIGFNSFTAATANSATVTFATPQSGRCVVSANSGAAAGSKSGTGDTLATTTGTLTSGDCARIDANGNIVDAGAPCGTSVVTGLGLSGVGAAGNPLQVDTTAVPARLSGTATLTFPSIGASSCAEQSLSLTGASTGDEVFAGPPANIDQGFLWSAYVSSSNTVTVRMCKITSGAVTPVTGSWRATIVRSF